jgi:hypothetical protein
VPALPVCPVAARFPSQGLPQLRTGARGKCGHARCSMWPWRPLNHVFVVHSLPTTDAGQSGPSGRMHHVQL